MPLIFLIISASYCLVVGSIFIFQRHLMYHPDRSIGPPAQYGLAGFTEHFAATPDDETVQLWYHPAAKGFPTIIYYHGNAYTMGDRANIYSALTDKGFGLLALSYRGYGKSTGSPTEQGIYIDARTAIHYASDTLQLPPEHLILYGESLGTGVATQMATEFHVAGVILQSPYTSVASRAAEIYFYIPVEYLIKDKYRTIDKIANINTPLMIFHGERDDVIPVEHGKTVFAAAKSPKEIFYFPDKAHNDFDNRVLSEHVLDFARKYNLIAH